MFFVSWFLKTAAVTSLLAAILSSSSFAALRFVEGIDSTPTT
jgi:hypothetical protein